MEGRGHVKGVEIDDTRLPLLIASFSESFADADLAAFHAACQRMLERKLPYAVVLDATAVARVSATQRKAQAEWMKANFADCQSYCAGLAFVIRSPVVRGIFTAILWLQSLPSPYVVVPERQAGIDWALGQLRVLETRDDSAAPRG